MKLNIGVFEGPLDLLLYLIKKNNLEISRVSIAEIAAQYLVYLETMKELDIDVASDFLLMAAELAHIKSKSLLPRDPLSQDEEESVDDADRLVAKLRVYQMYKNAALALQRRILLGRDVFKRASFSKDFSEDVVTTPPEKPQIGAYRVEIYDLMRAFGDVLKRLPTEEREHHVQAERVSVTDRMYEILHSLESCEHVLFTDLFVSEAKKVDWVVSFLAILEMVRLKVAHIYQNEIMGPIRIQKRIETTNLFSHQDLEKPEPDYR